MERGDVRGGGIAIISSKLFISFDQRVLPLQYPGL